MMINVTLIGLQHTVELGHLWSLAKSIPYEAPNLSRAAISQQFSQPCHFSLAQLWRTAQYQRRTDNQSGTPGPWKCIVIQDTLHGRKF